LDVPPTGKPVAVNGEHAISGAVSGMVGAMSMTGVRTLASELGLLDTGTPPESVAEQGLPQLLRPVPPAWRPAAVDLLHVAYGAAGGAAFTLLPENWAAARTAGPCSGSCCGSATSPRSHRSSACVRSERRRGLREWAVLAADHVLYGFIVSRLGGRS
jgi:hypothetical protein